MIFFLWKLIYGNLFNLRKEFLIIKMSQVEKSIYEESSENDSFTDSLSSQSTESDYIPSQTPESEDYTSYESSEPLTPSESSDSEYSQ